MQRWDIGSGHLFIAQGDITTFEGDAIVNAANSKLAGGGGVDGAIHKAAGERELQQACAVIIAKISVLPVGEAVITPGFNLPVQHIVHTVGPIWRGGKSNEPKLLQSAYQKCLWLARNNNIKTIAFPAISCGVYGYPAKEAARIALPTLKSGVQAGLVQEAGMVLYSEEAFSTWTAIAKNIV